MRGSPHCLPGGPAPDSGLLPGDWVWRTRAPKECSRLGLRPGLVASRKVCGMGCAVLGGPEDPPGAALAAGGGGRSLGGAWEAAEAKLCRWSGGRAGGWERSWRVRQQGLQSELGGYPKGKEEPSSRAWGPTRALQHSLPCGE